MKRIVLALALLMMTTSTPVYSQIKKDVGNINPTSFEYIRINKRLPSSATERISAEYKNSNRQAKDLSEITRDSIQNIYGVLLMENVFSYSIKNDTINNIELLSILSQVDMNKADLTTIESRSKELEELMGVINSFKVSYRETTNTIIVMNNIIDYLRSIEVGYQHKPLSTIDNNSIFSIVNENKAMCMGLTQLTYQLLNTTNVTHRVALIQDEKRGVYHIYNEVFSNNKWVEFDVSYILDNNSSVDFVINNNINKHRFKTLHSSPIRRGVLQSADYQVSVP